MRYRYLLLFLPLFAIVLVLGASSVAPKTASADGGIHVKGMGATPDSCPACHRVHRGQAELLLVQEEDTLCYSCHGTAAAGSVLDVRDGIDDYANAALRGGGFVNARLNTTDSSGIGPTPVSGTPVPKTVGVLSTGQTVLSSHSVDSSAQTVWGFGAVSAVATPGLTGYNLACGKCHDPHGDGNYRILRTVPSDLFGHGATIPSWFTNNVPLADEGTKQYTTTNYWDISYTDFWTDNSATKDGTVTPVEQTGRQVGKWCTTCHTRYLAPSGAFSVDSGDAIFKYRHATDAQTRVRDGSTTQASPASCLQCHVAHGSNAVMGANASAVTFPDGSAAATPGTGGNEPGALLKMDGRGVCQKCHNK